ncbi:MAG: hypothetical protein ACO3SJ_05515 [Phycisphaerales bacterium]
MDLRSEIDSLLSEDELRFDDEGPGAARVRTHPLGCEVLVDASWREQSTPGPKSSHSPRSWTVRRTFVFLHRPSLTFPEFELLPRGSFGDRLFAGLSGLLGVPTLEIADHPEFSKRYTIVTANGGSVRALLSREALDALAAFDDLRIKVGRHGVLVHRAIGSSWSDGRDRDERLDEAARARLVEDALAACATFANDPVAAKRAESAVAGTYREEATENLASAGGLVGHLVRRHLVTAEMVDSIREQPPPRADIPPPIARRAWRGTTFPLLLLLAFCLAFPALGIGLLLKTAPDGDDRVVGGVFTGLGVVAIVIWSFILRHRLIRQRLVRRGVAVDASIAQVERTNTSVNNDRIHRIHFEVSGEPAPIIVKVGSAEATLARALQKRRERTWVLQDPSVPSRGLWIEGWANRSE